MGDHYLIAILQSHKNILATSASNIGITPVFIPTFLCPFVDTLIRSLEAQAQLVAKHGGGEGKVGGEHGDGETGE